MSSDNPKSEDQGSPMAAWIESATDYWTSTARTWTDMLSASVNTPGQAKAFTSNFEAGAQESWQASSMMWQAFFSSMGNPSAIEGFLKGSNGFPDILLQMIGTGCDGYSQLYQQWLKRFGEPGQACSSENPNQDLFKTWMQFYEKGIQPLLNVPQVGLTRVYQENVNQAVDKFNLYQMAVTEFMQLLYLPVEKSFHIMEEKFEQFRKEGTLSEDFNDYYSMWIKVLEGNYMALLKSPDYLQSLCRTLYTVQDFKLAQHRLITDALQTLPIPTNKDMDEVYKELYTLKKKVKELTKKMGPSEPAPVHSAPEN